MDEAQRLASLVVLRVLGGRSLDAALQAVRDHDERLSTQQRAQIQDLSFGALRHLGFLDALLALLIDRPLREERLGCLLRVALYQLAFTRAAAHTIVDQAVRAAVRLHHAAAKGLVNAVLRNFLRQRSALCAKARRTDEGRYSYPGWWIDKVKRQYPAQYGAILEAGNLHPPMTLRVNRRRGARNAYLQALEAAGIAARALDDDAVMLERPRPVAQVPGFIEGIVSVQDAAAQRAAQMLDLAAGQTVLDACAAPGGKAAHILERADVRLTALDNDATRLNRLRANFERLGLAAHIVHGDAGNPREWWAGRPYERILADVPCTASGVVKRHPDIKWLRRPADIAQFAAVQATMLEALWQLLATGGKLLYATCSIFHEENALQLERFLESHRDARRLTLPGDDTNRQQPAGQILPDESHDGFFYALVQKN
ncbi:MAG TPA: 16S rRNA (cytosine(967)-C(5))-methyltransferase RsmB [Burkholderiales bacterium]|nr:16S rRNA (cytosine(967)-C(5))-methyltransferase RsmB [Burkholderiales bacterium]